MMIGFSSHFYALPSHFLQLRRRRLACLLMQCLVDLLPQRLKDYLNRRVSIDLYDNVPIVVD